MSQFEEDLSIRLENIKDSNFKIKIKNSFRGNEKYKNHINELKQKGIAISSMGHGKLRIVTHLDYKEVMHEYVMEVFSKLTF